MGEEKPAAAALGAPEPHNNKRPPLFWSNPARWVRIVCIARQPIGSAAAK